MNQETLTIIVAIVGSGGFGETLHQQMVNDGGVCTVEVKQTAERIYKAYHGLGGNGVGTEMRNDILNAHIKGN